MGILTMIKVKSHAKLNISLEVISTRDDRYHNIATVIQSVGLFDELIFSQSVTQGIDVSIGGTVDNSSFNLINKSAELIRNLHGIHEGVDISLKKTIPFSSGLGGGSSNAAATILALDKFWNLKLSKKELLDIASIVGSDVAYFVNNRGTALISGRGDIIRPLKPPPAGFALIITNDQTPLVNKTASLYSLLVPSDFTNGSFVESVVIAIEKSDSWAQIYSLSEPTNTFAKYIKPTFESIDLDRIYSEFKQELPGMYFSGTGPSFYSIFDDYTQAIDASKLLESDLFRATVVPLVDTPIELSEV